MSYFNFKTTLLVATSLLGFSMNIHAMQEAERAPNAGKSLGYDAVREFNAGNLMAEALKLATDASLVEADVAKEKELEQYVKSLRSNVVDCINSTPTFNGVADLYAFRSSVCEPLESYLMMLAAGENAYPSLKVAIMGEINPMLGIMKTNCERLTKFCEDRKIDASKGNAHLGRFYAQLFAPLNKHHEIYSRICESLEKNEELLSVILKSPALKPAQTMADFKATNDIETRFKTFKGKLTELGVEKLFADLGLVEQEIRDLLYPKK